MSVNILPCDKGKVYLIAGGGKYFSATAAAFCRSLKDVEDLIADEESKAIIRHLISSNHKAALEFDDFIFGIEGYSRVTEVQLVRKRMASYMISSGRVNHKGKRPFDVVIPDSVTDFSAQCTLNPADIKLRGISGTELVENSLAECLPLIQRQLGLNNPPQAIYIYNYRNILDLIDSWYTTGVELGKPEEDLRYMKPQATAFKAAVKMNASALRDWFMIRCCNRAQHEIRSLAKQMLALCREASPALFEDAGPSCRVLGYCQETEQCRQCKGKIPTKKQVLSYVEAHKEEVLNGSGK